MIWFIAPYAGSDGFERTHVLIRALPRFRQFFFSSLVLATVATMKKMKARKAMGKRTYPKVEVVTAR